MGKSEILAKFSATPDRYYQVKLFEEKGFVRKSCIKCKRFFWTLDSNRVHCPDDSDDTYSFIGNPPTSKRFDYTQAWKEVEDFFVKNGHTSVNRYPVVCRWRDDLYFTIASIVDFQRVMGSKVIFEFPANPLVVPQTCLRFKDMENVGVTGRHFSSFCMIGQHSIPNNQGYWKDECVDLDFRLLTEQFGIKQEEIVFVEDVWEGGGSFGSSLEYFVRGLELGNAVFTEFQGELNNPTILDQKIIDMGAGLERFAWITKGTPTAYDCCFGPITNFLNEKAGIDLEQNFLSDYFKNIAINLEVFPNINEVRKKAFEKTRISESQINKIITPLESLYLISDHLRTLIFAISDGALPSNVGGGYNLRMVLRRIMNAINTLGFRINLDELIDLHIDYLKNTYPELEKTREDVKTIISIETKRYDQSKSRMQKIADNIKKSKKTPTTSDLVRLYESDGITPDYLKEFEIISDVPPEFYSKLSELHQNKKTEIVSPISFEGLPETELLFYKDDPTEFSAKVLKTSENMVILDRTSFYARGGGQEPDHGTISGFKVIDVKKHGNLVIHELEGGVPNEGDEIKGVIDRVRRENITKHHTGTHILNSSARNILGSWVWQHSAFKESTYGRLDITHHSNLSDEQISQIELLANSIIQKNFSVSIDEYERGIAEQKFGFRIYQGGVVPVKNVRIVNIEGFDIEACGGTHVKRTGQLGLLKIIKSDRIQDGVVRLEFVSGTEAIKFIQKQDNEISQIANLLQSDKNKVTQSFQHNLEESNSVKKKFKHLAKRTKNLNAQKLISKAQNIGKIKLISLVEEELDSDFHILIGEETIKIDPTIVYFCLVVSKNNIKIIVFAGEEASKIISAGIIVKQISEILGGSGGGNSRFGQGGGTNTSKIKEAQTKIHEIISN